MCALFCLWLCGADGFVILFFCFIVVGCSVFFCLTIEGFFNALTWLTHTHATSIPCDWWSVCVCTISHLHNAILHSYLLGASFLHFVLETIACKCISLNRQRSSPTVWLDTKTEEKKWRLDDALFWCTVSFALVFLRSSLFRLLPFLWMNSSVSANKSCSKKQIYNSHYNERSAMLRSAYIISWFPSAIFLFARCNFVLQNKTSTRCCQIYTHNSFIIIIIIVQL